MTLKSSVKKTMPNGFFTLEDNDLLVLSPSGQPMEDQEITVHRGALDPHRRRP